MGHWISRILYTEVNMLEVFTSSPLLFSAGGTFACVLLSFRNGEADNDSLYH